MCEPLVRSYRPIGKAAAADGPCCSVELEQGVHIIDDTAATRPRVRAPQSAIMLQKSPSGTWFPSWVPESTFIVMVLLLLCSMVQSAVCVEVCSLPRC